METVRGKEREGKREEGKEGGGGREKEGGRERRIEGERQGQSTLLAVTFRRNFSSQLRLGH